MASRTQVNPARVFTSLADIVYEGSTPAEIYAAVCVAATLIVPGCDRASLMLRRNGTYKTAAASDAIARKIDALARELGDGPWVNACDDRNAQLETDLATSDRWPSLAKRVIAETPVRGALGCRLLVDRETLGVLNVFSDAPGVLTETSVERASVLAAFATVATHAAAHGQDAATLRRGLDSNREIGKAIGMLMVRDDISDTDAFDVLRRASQDRNIKLVELATEVVRRAGRSADQP
ncbi:hypothetical protein [Rhodococcus jostii RHA1] [Mycobacterium shimoidei]|uniref:ANTAR domain-containing protein n=1 Tax=Mycobacterium shimoidei TaxID=29313 RepID=A0A375YU52_MYCSH|nr:hypothetical protein [Rhodococcus jostii RHA1] [Mycobacterium shimoidei]